MKNPIDEFVRLALVGAGGSMNGAAEKLRWSLAELLEHLARTPRLREFLAEHREGLADNAERHLEAAIDESCPWAIKYALKTLGASRGYGMSPTREQGNDPVSPTRKQGNDPVSPTREQGNDPVSPTRKQGNDPVSPTRKQEGEGEGDNNPPAEQQAEIEQLLQGKTEAQVAAALEGAKGSMLHASAKLDMSRANIKKIVAGRPTLQAIIVEMRERRIDKAELALHGAVAEKKAWAIKFVLGTMGRARGYVRQHGTIPERSNAAAQPNPSPPNMSPRADEWPGANADAPTLREAVPTRPSPDLSEFLPECALSAKKRAERRQ